MKGAKVSDVIAAMGSFKDDEINASELRKNQTAVVGIFDYVEWN